MNKKLRQLTATIACLSCTSAIDAADIFEVTATTTDLLPLLQTTVGSSDIIPLINQASSAQGAFAPFALRAYSANLSYAGVPNAMNIAFNAAGTTATLTSPLTGLSVTFAGANRTVLQSQIEDYLKNSGSAEYGRMMNIINARSLVSVTDGNPGSSTASIANQAFRELADMPRRHSHAGMSPDLDSNWALSADAEYTTANPKGFNVDTFSLPIRASLGVGEIAGINITVPLSWSKIKADGGSGSATVWRGGVNIGIPIHIMNSSGRGDWGWKVAPIGGVNFVGSEDMGTGGMLLHGGIGNAVSYDFDRFRLMVLSQCSYHTSMSFSLGGYDFDPGVNSMILKNGLRASIPISRSWALEPYATYTTFLDSAAIDQYITLGIDGFYFFGGRGGNPPKHLGHLRAGAYTDLADDYTSFSFRVGAGWHF